MGKETTDPLVIEALEWLVRLRDDKAGEEVRRAFQTWFDQSEAHVAAWEHAQAFWKRFDIVQPEIESIRNSQKFLNRRNLLLGGGAALVGTGGLYAISRSDLFADFVTDIGERRTWTLADGSLIELGSYSALSSNFTETSRQFELHRGEGFFDVAAASKRPFSVNAAGGTTHALGTKFNVKYVGDLVTVTASEHAVMVRVGASSPAKIEQGWQLSYSKSGLGNVTRVDLGSIEAWRQDRIVFQDVPLRRVLTELERYRQGRIILTSKSIGDIPVTAIFSTKQPEEALQTIADTLPIRILHATKYVSFVYSV
ncbi:FecR family protein [Pseudorhodoplanes sinuspersici]|uniref:Iron dicitrate transport regulator FecR n=1 Tax=Pseudorhodoplanes sinuspersici TaxID=1235591 RepID=A0A1W6ZP20_9HYPH|nr:FecR family protein [Pseudorhodoplanes sinuspersici]ARP99005.1 iron dicitrate transport regulator FecR [Pseudorhodoplanes sinuspersici]RKE69354.1 FecR family protein [Pseudorhodoplanes sinuspersici]